jgi:hypothetical protein
VQKKNKEKQQERQIFIQKYKKREKVILAQMTVRARAKKEMTETQFWKNFQQEKKKKKRVKKPNREIKERKRKNASQKKNEKNGETGKHKTKK